MWKAAALIAAGLIVPSACYGQSPDLTGFSKVLVPIVFPETRGLYGLTFQTEFQIYNPKSMRVFPAYDGPGAAPVIREISPEYPFPLPGDFGPPQRAAGRFLFIDFSGYPTATFENFLSYSSASDSAGGGLVSLPVARGEQFASGTRYILSVPFTWRISGDLGSRVAIPLYRRTLRIFNWEDRGGERVSVSLTLEATGPGTTPLRRFVVLMDQRDGSDPSYPFYAELPLADICITLFRSTPCESFFFRVTIEPDRADLRFYALITVADNETQHVTVFTSQ